MEKICYTLAQEMDALILQKRFSENIIAVKLSIEKINLVGHH